MSRTDERLDSYPTESGEEARLWRTTAAIIAFDVDGGGAVAFRHTSGQAGTLLAEDNLNGRMRIVDERSGEVSAYESVEALVLDGWSLCESAAEWAVMQASD